MKHEVIDKLFIAVLVGGCVLHPASSAVALCVFLSYQIAERYFKANIFDQDKRDLEALKTDVIKLKQHQQSIDLGKAFGGRG